MNKLFYLYNGPISFTKKKLLMYVYITIVEFKYSMWKRQWAHTWFLNPRVTVNVSELWTLFCVWWVRVIPNKCINNIILFWTCQWDWIDCLATPLGDLPTGVQGIPTGVASGVPTVTYWIYMKALELENIQSQKQGQGPCSSWSELRVLSGFHYWPWPVLEHETENFWIHSKVQWAS